MGKTPSNLMTAPVCRLRPPLILRTVRARPDALPYATLPNATPLHCTPRQYKALFAPLIEGGKIHAHSVTPLSVTDAPINL